DGDWHDQEIAFSGKGTQAAPITLRAATPGKVRLLGNSRLLMHGDHLVASGLFFGDASSSESIVDIKGNENRFTDSMIIAPHRAGPWVHFTGGRHSRMDPCYIEGHAPKDVPLQ